MQIFLYNKEYKTEEFQKRFKNLTNIKCDTTTEGEPKTVTNKIVVSTGTLLVPCALLSLKIDVVFKVL